MANRTDGWLNVLTGKGSSLDKRTHTTYSAGEAIPQNVMMDLYAYNGFFNRVVSTFPSEMVRAWFTIENDPERYILSKLEQMTARPVLRESLTWANLFGGSVCLIGVNDGQRDLKQPVNMNNIQDIMFLKAFDRERVTINTSDLYNDPTFAKYGQPRLYNINPLNMPPITVHESRILRFDGQTLPDTLKSQNQWWGASILNRIYEQIRALGGVYDNVELITEDFIQSALTIKGLADLISGGQEKVVKDRLEILDLSRHILNTMLLDEGEVYTKHSSTVTGLPEVIDKFIQAVSFVTGIPVTILAGESPAGLNATGASDLRMFYDKVSTEQEDVLKPQLEKLVRYLFLSKKDNPYGGREPEDWSITFNPLWQPTAKEETDTRKVQSDIDVAYINAGVLSPEEIAISRFGSGVYSDTTTLQTERLIENNPEPEPEEPENEGSDTEEDPEADAGASSDSSR